MATEAPRPEEDGFSEVGSRVRAARAKCGMTRKQLAAASATSERYLALIEAGAGNPSLGVLTTLADALGIAVAELLPLGGERSVTAMQASAMVRRLPLERLKALQSWVEGRGGEQAEKGHRIVLIGLRGAGKSSLGEELAHRLNMPFFELSTEVERAYGGDLGLLIELSGHGALRRYEAEAWEAIRSANQAAVIAAPGGIVADGPLYDRVLATAHTIWLQATPEDHMERVLAQGDFRPMASNRGAMDDLKSILEARAFDYARADARIDTSAQSFEPTLDALVRHVRLMMS